MRATRAVGGALGAVVAAGALLVGCSGQSGPVRPEAATSGAGSAQGSADEAENEEQSTAVAEEQPTAVESASLSDTVSAESLSSLADDSDASIGRSEDLDVALDHEQQQEPEPAVEPVDPVEAVEPDRGPESAAEPVEAASEADDEFAVEVVEELAPSETAGGARQDAPVEPVETEQSGESGGAGDLSSAQGEVYMWHDGDRTVGARLLLDLVVVADGEIVSKDDIVADTGEGQIVTRSAESGAGADGTPGSHPVFLSESGTLMALPGGVILVLDADWDTDGTDAFFARNSISLDRVSELSYLANGFFVETDPGFASLGLANALAGQAGVELSSPNWWRERTTK